jgi:uncharacterized protein (DUF1684 family)
MFKFRIASLFVAVLISFVGLNLLEKRKERVLMNNQYTIELEAFHKKAEERLRSSDGWLAVVGLSWLNVGTNTVGSAKSSQVTLPITAPKELATIKMAKDRSAKIRFHPEALQTSEWATVNDKPAEAGKWYDLMSDKTDEPTMIRYSSVSFFLIDRKNGLGVRVRDSAAETRQSFKGRAWYPAREQFNITAKWVAHKEPKKIQIPDILGNLNDELSPGFAQFQIEGQTVELHPTQEGDNLFFVFRDATSGKDTYGAARFLYASLAKEGRVHLDFNRAVNPPCAFTNFATCPIPPPENILKVEIAAGEKKPLSAAH